MENKKRLFTFGCSFTQYNWPTWADILGRSLHQEGWEFHNMGRAGVGNMQIMKTILKAKQVYNFTPDDKLMVMWSSWNREDRYLPDKTPGGGWILEGNVLNNKFYDQDFIEKYWSLEHDIIQSWSAISATRQLVKLDFEGSIPPVEGLDEPSDDELLKEFCDLEMPNILQPPAHDENNLDPVVCLDGHPKPALALDYVDNVITPLTGLSINQNTRDWAKTWDAWLNSVFAPVLTDPEPDKCWNLVMSNVNKRYISEHRRFRSENHLQNFWDPANFLDYFKDIKKQL